MPESDAPQLDIGSGCAPRWGTGFEMQTLCVPRIALALEPAESAIGVESRASPPHRASRPSRTMRKTPFAVLAATLFLSACWTTHVVLKYQAPANAVPAAPGTPAIAVGAFSDMRGSKPNWIGRIRGTFGNTLETLVIDQPVAALVQAQFRAGLEARQFSVVQAGAAYDITGQVRQLSSIQYVHIDTSVEIEVLVRRLPSREATFVHVYSAKAVEASRTYSVLAAGTVRPAEGIRALTERTLRDVVNQALDDRAFRDALHP